MELLFCMLVNVYTAFGYVDASYFGSVCQPHEDMVQEMTFEPMYITVNRTQGKFYTR